MVTGEASDHSLIRLVTDRHSSIPAMLMDPQGDLGAQVIAYGACVGTGDWREMDLRFVEDKEGMLVGPGQFVVTAGGPGPIPRGMVLGEVVSAHTSAHSDTWTIAVAPWRDSRLASTLTVLYPQPTGVP